MPEVPTEALIVLLLVLANGVFAMAEIALVSARKIRLEQRAESGDRRAARALALKNDPNAFLSTVQVGITLIGILAGAYGGATLSQQLDVWFQQFPLLAPYSNALALAVVVGAITYLSLILGELVPKAIALTNPEAIAAFVAAPIGVLARVATPAVRLLSGSTRLVLKLLRIHERQDAGVTEEEIRMLVKQATLSGEVALVEQQIVEQVFRLGDRHVSAIMTPRHDIDWIDINEGLDGLRAHLEVVRHPRLVCCDGGLEHVLGIAQAEELFAKLLAGEPIDLRASLRPPLFVPATLSVYHLIEEFRRQHVHIALVLDEFGAIEGLVTATDILESLVGDMPSEPHDEAGPMVRREDGSWLIDGVTPLDDLAPAVELPPLPPAEQGAYQTLAGLVMARLARVPRAGDYVVWAGYRFEVVDMDGRRIDKVLVQQERPVETAPQVKADR